MAQDVNSTAYDLMLSTLLSHDIEEIDVAECIELDNPILIDSRSKEEYEVSHIKNAIWVGFKDPDMDKVKELDRDRKVVVYCSVGYRSEKIAQNLIDMGFNDVLNLYGGIFEWVNQDQPVVDQSGKPTKKVHAYNKMWGFWLDKGEKVYSTDR